jgi:F-type H+-transporting ATPase subunit b
VGETRGPLDGNPMIKLPDVTMLYVIFSFAIACAILRRYLFAPLAEILDARDRDAADAAALHAESAERLRRALAEAEQNLSLARREALKVREELRGEGRARLEARLAEAGAAAAAAVEAANGEIAEQSRALGRELPERSRSLARDLAEKILGRKLAA